MVLGEGEGGGRRGGSYATQPQRILHRYLSSDSSYCHHKQRARPRAIIPCGKAFASNTICLIDLLSQNANHNNMIYAIYVYIYLGLLHANLSPSLASFTVCWSEHPWTAIDNRIRLNRVPSIDAPFPQTSVTASRS